LTETLKPFVDINLEKKKEREYTGIGGVDGCLGQYFSGIVIQKYLVD
jgi:hypothetical protein